MIHQTPKTATPPLRLDTSPYTDAELWKLGFKDNWDALEHILQPVVKEDFAVIDTNTQVFLDGVRKKFDSTGQTHGNNIITTIIARESSNTSSAEAFLKRLVLTGLSPDVPNREGTRPSHFLGREGTVELARIILPCRPDMNAQNRNGYTPLIAATGTYKVF